MAEIKRVFSGEVEVDKIFCGTDLVHEKEPADTTAPTTTANPAGGAYTAAQTVWLEVNEACTTYYTTDGTTPTTNSAVFTEELTIDADTTLKFFSVDTAGNIEAVKTEVYTIGVRYVRYIGHGDNTSTTTRLVEIQALEGVTNRLLNLIPITGETPNGGTIEQATDGIISFASGEYPYWWTGEGVPELIYDLGVLYPIDTLKVVMYSPDVDPRQTQFMLYVSTDNINWNLIADMSQNTTAQSEEGWTYTL